MSAGVCMLVPGGDPPLSSGFDGAGFVAAAWLRGPSRSRGTGWPGLGVAERTQTTVAVPNDVLVPCPRG